MNQIYANSRTLEAKPTEMTWAESRRDAAWGMAITFATMSLFGGLMNLDFTNLTWSFGKTALGAVGAAIYGIIAGVSYGSLFKEG